MLYAVSSTSIEFWWRSWPQVQHSCSHHSWAIWTAQFFLGIRLAAGQTGDFCENRVWSKTLQVGWSCRQSTVKNLSSWEVLSSLCPCLESAFWGHRSQSWGQFQGIAWNLRQLYTRHSQSQALRKLFALFRSSFQSVTWSSSLTWGSALQEPHADDLRLSWTLSSLLLLLFLRLTTALPSRGTSGGRTFSWTYRKRRSHLESRTRRLEARLTLLGKCCSQKTSV